MNQLERRLEALETVYQPAQPSPQDCGYDVTRLTFEERQDLIRIGTTARERGLAAVADEDLDRIDYLRKKMKRELA